MEYSRANVGQMLLDDFVDLVASIYSSHDCNRSIWDVWCHTLHHAASISERIRMGDHPKLRKEIAHFSLWLFTAVLKMRGTFGEPKDGSETPQTSLIRINSGCSDLIWHKYPKLCPSCSTERIARCTAITGVGCFFPCECQMRERKAEDKEMRRIRLNVVSQHSVRVTGERPTRIDDWQKMFGSVFRQTLVELSLAGIALHLLEELGEVSDAMIRIYSYTEPDFQVGEPNRRRENLESQLADVFSWLFALVEKLDLSEPERQGEQGCGAEGNGAKSIFLSRIIWDSYGSEGLHAFHCAKCQKVKCSCPIILIPFTRSIEELKALDR
jgi:NTP pyrophosphatase (non-canonical NTP hydrolase)